MLFSIIIALGDAKDARAGPALVEMLGNKDPEVRGYAARAIGESGYKDGAAALEKSPAIRKKMRTSACAPRAPGAKLGHAACLMALGALADSPQPRDSRARRIRPGQARRRPTNTGARKKPRG